MDFRCDCGAPCDGTLGCIVSGQHYRYCEAYLDRDERGDPPHGMANLAPIVEAIKADVKTARRNYFQEMRSPKP